MKIFRSVLFFLFLIISCDSTENRSINVYNESNVIIYCFVSKRDFQKVSDITETDFASEIEANDFGMMNPTRVFWEDYIKSCDDNKIRVYIIEKDSVDKYGWSSIFKNNMYKKEYVYSIDDLEDIDWEIENK